MEIDKKLYSEIKAYCELNNLKTRDYIHDLLKKAFLEDKYGKAPAFMKKEVEKASKESIEVFKIEESVENINKKENIKEVEKKEETTVIPEKKIVKTIKRTLNE